MRDPSADAPIVVLSDRYGTPSETFVATEVEALRRRGLAVSVESVDGDAADRVWLRDDTPATRARAMVLLAARHPLRCARDLRDRRRWRRAEPAPPLRMLAPAALRYRPGVHVHVHFAAAAALSAMRIARITGATWSVTAHAWDIYKQPANLAEKLRAAAFATSGCEYTVRDLRRHAPDVHVVVMGVDAERFRRRTPHPSGRVIVAVGRLVEKKGFDDLVRAVALLRPPPDRVVIAGDGPEAPRLAALVAAEGLERVVEMPGALPGAEVRALLEQAAVVAVPCVVAADGDRDSMPVIAKEALAMEVPVVATDEVGLPELVRPAWGRLVPPRDPAALAAALDELLALDPAERARMGQAGREHVSAHCNPDVEAGRLAELIARARNR